MASSGIAMEEDQDLADRELIIERIRKIFAKTVENGATEEEAILSAQKGQEMLAKHNLDRSHIDEAKEEYGHLLADDYYNEPWVLSIMQASARFYFCKYLRDRKDVPSKRASEKPRKVSVHTFIGRRGNVEAAKALADFLESTVRRLAKEAEAEQRRKHPTRDPRAHGNDFKRGCGFRIAERLNELRAASTSEGNRTKLPALYLGEDEGAGKYASRVFGADEKVALAQRHEVTVGYLNGEAAADRIEIEQKQLSEC